MKIHHLNCGTIRVFGGNALIGNARPFERAEGVAHCLLLESEEGLLLVDTGFGRQDCTDPSLFLQWMMSMAGFSRDVSETAYEQIRALGYDPRDVRHVALTHFHYDHAGGLPDFPDAQVHINAEEYAAVIHPQDMYERYPYRKEHWAHGPDWHIHDHQGDHWFGLPRTGMIELGSTRFCFVPLPGHTRGHAAVAVQVGDIWLLHCGDAYTYHGHVHPTHPHQPDYAFMTMPLMQLNKAFRQIGKYNQRLQQLLRAHGEQVVLTCSHDVVEFEKFSGHGVQALAQRQRDGAWERSHR